ncbi:DUF4156 domain-containing protein, partial [Enterobacter hormaechei]|uniref:DUF4156 domain-containing protein n=1 Tax=Enterobacter hormaechei TaxID=158836 RepID=UPI000AE74C97
GTVCVVGKMRDLILQLSKSSIYSTKPFLGEVTGSQGNFFTGGWTSNSNLETGARNDLKNQAYSMGGNVVVILTQRAGQTGSAYFGSGSSQQTNVTLSGTVYRCNN